MSMTVATPYRKREPKPPIEVSALPLYGIGNISDYTNYSQMNSTFQSVQADPVNDPLIYLPATDENTFAYYLCPLEFGLVTFKDSTGQQGGWDGASWPGDEVGEQYGPVVVRFKDRDWNLYRTDFPGGIGGIYTTGFANG